MALVVNRLQLEAALCKESFFDFFLRFWPVVCPENLVCNWHIKYLCDELQEMAEKVIRREEKEHDLVINISPGTTKSTIVSVLFPCWCWSKDSTLRIICGSYSYDLSLDLASKRNLVIASEKYKTLFPEVHLRKESMGLLESDRSGQLIATSVGGSITGKHAHIILIDDPINPKEALSDVGLKGAVDWMDQTLRSRMVDKAVTPTILVMQRLHQGDPTGHMLGKRPMVPIRYICLPAVLNKYVRPRMLKQNYVDGLFDPRRLSKKILTQTEAEMGSYAYAGQYLQHPIPIGGGMFRTDQIGIFLNAPGMPGHVVRSWDKAGTGGKGCFTVGVKMGRLNDNTFVIFDVVRGQWEANERERIIRQTAERDGRSVLQIVEQEPGSGGKESAQNTVKNLMGYRVRCERPVGDKALRADPYAYQVNGGSVRLVRAEWNSVYLQELQYFPFSKFKDQVDASSQAFAALVKARRMVGGFG